MKSRKIQIAVASVLAAGLSTGVQAATYNAIQDTYIYELLGNQGSPTGDSGVISVWDHETNHGGKGLVQFDAGAVAEATAAGVGNFTATMNLYSNCTTGGFIAACAGDLDTNNPWGASTVPIDVLLQSTSWAEGDAAMTWDSVTEDSTPFTTMFVDGNGWFSVDVTSLLETMVTSATDYGFSLSSEYYTNDNTNRAPEQVGDSVIRVDAGGTPVVQFCDSESSSGMCASGSFAPTLTVSAVPVPAAVWLFGSGLLGLVGVARRKKAATLI